MDELDCEAGGRQMDREGLVSRGRASQENTLAGQSGETPGGKVRKRTEGTAGYIFLLLLFIASAQPFFENCAYGDLRDIFGNFCFAFLMMRQQMLLCSLLAIGCPLPVMRRLLLQESLPAVAPPPAPVPAW
jgi:hypothetical protein